MINNNSLCRELILCTLILVSLPLFAETVTQSLSNIELQNTIKYTESLTQVPMLERELIMRKSKVFFVKLSPNGESIAFLKKEGKERTKLASFWLYNIKEMTFKKLFSFRNIADIKWSSDSKKIFIAVPEGIAVSHVYANASPFIIKRLEPELREQWIGVDDNLPASVLVQVWDRKNRQFVIERIQSDGKSKKIYRAEQYLLNFITDNQGNPSLVTDINRAEDSQGEKFIFDISSTKRDLIWTCKWDDGCRAYFHDKKNQRLLLSTNKNANLKRLVWVDLKTKKLSPIHEDPLAVSDINSMSWAFDVDNNSVKPLLFSYHGDNRRRYGANKIIQEHINEIEKSIDSDYMIVSPPVIDSIHKVSWLIHDRSSKKRISHFYIYNPKTRKVSQPLMEFIDKVNDDIDIIDEQHVAPTFPVHYRSSDGFNLQGYVTIPPGVKLAEAPLVTKVHGGPYSRVKNNYESSAQTLANRGYIVFQPNFRSSTGFGKAYRSSILRDFGDGRVQQDIIEGVEYLVSQGIGDKERLGIVGHSFGGFSVLGAMAFTPELFQVGFAGAPPDDIGRSVQFYKRFIRKQRSEMDEYIFKISIVDWNDKKAVAANTKKSPSAKIHKITKPLVIWAGKNDGRVFVVDVKDYVLRLEELNKKVTLFVDPKAKHSPASKVGLLAYLYLMEKTLADNLGGKTQPLDAIKDQQLIRYLKKNMLVDYNDMTPQ
ncbi:MAG: dipeptidyl aminopeptidase/acylaminoacyl peptidase [Enterobacterales bacterium]|jgi:dipeptidyl aminopeptidase/acylaminoacyl peptidase